MEETGREIICGAPTTLAVEGWTMVMMGKKKSKSKRSCNVNRKKKISFNRSFKKNTMTDGHEHNDVFFFFVMGALCFVFCVLPENVVRSYFDRKIGYFNQVSPDFFYK